MWTRLSKISGPLLLGWGLVWAGAKTPLTFFAWGSGALLLCGLLWTLRPTSPRPSYTLELLFLVFILLSYVFSKDMGASLFLTTQAILFWILWITLKTYPQLTQSDRPFEITLVGVAVASLAATGFQILQGNWRQAYGLLPLNPTFNAVWMAVLAVFLFRPSSSRTHTLVRRIIAILLIVLVFFGPSRQTPIALVIGLGYLWWPWFTAKRVIKLLLGLVLVLSLIPRDLVRKRIRFGEVNYRTSIWAVALRAADERPWTGYGWGNFELAYQKYAFPVETDTIRYARTTPFAHNEFLQVASDMGVPAMGLFLFGWIALFRRPTGSRRAVKAGLLLMMTSAFTTFIWHLPLLLYLTLFASAMLWHTGTPPELKKNGQRPPAVLGIALLLFIAGTWMELGWQALRQHWAHHDRWDHILARDPRDAEAWHQWAFQQNEPDRALYGFAQAARLSPFQVYYHEAYARAVESMPHPDLELAIREYQQALFCAPTRAPNALAIGRVLFREHRWAEATPWFKYARQIEPHYWECDLWLARCRYVQGHPQRALWILRNLDHRRRVYLQERERYALTGGNDPSSYEQSILAYDPQVIQKEIQHFQS